MWWLSYLKYLFHDYTGWQANMFPHSPVRPGFIPFNRIYCTFWTFAETSWKCICFCAFWNYSLHCRQQFSFLSHTLLPVKCYQEDLKIIDKTSVCFWNRIQPRNVEVNLLDCMLWLESSFFSPSVAQQIWLLELVAFFSDDAQQYIHHLII